MTAITLGLAYPFQLAQLERFKMHYTFYGELGGQFAGAGTRLFVRGLPMWLLVMGPLMVAVFGVHEMVDGAALIDALQSGGDNIAALAEGGNPLLGAAVVFALLMVALSITAAALLYPVFQAMVLRWWLSGLRFGPVKVHSMLRTRHVYGAYGLFILHALLFSLAMLLVATPALWFAGSLGESASLGAEAGATLMLLAVYVTGALGFSTIYRATVMLSLWQLGMESLQLSGLSALDGVTAKGRASSPLGEGLSDALNVGGY